MGYILAKFKIKTEPKNYLLSGTFQKLIIQKEDIIEGVEFLDQVESYYKYLDSFLAIFEVEPNNKKYKQNKRLLFNTIKTNIQTGNQDNQEYYLLLDFYNLYYPVIRWIGTDLNKKAICNIIYNVQAINLGFVNNPNVLYYIPEDPTRELDFNDLDLDNIIQYV